MDVPSLLVGAGLLLAGFVVGRLTAPRERTTVLYPPPPPPRHQDAGAPAGGADANDAEVEALLRAGHKIQAVRRHRELYGTGLKEAKDAVDAIEARLRLSR